MSRAVPNRLRPLLVTLLSAGWILVVVAVGSSPASAHAEVTGSDPADGSTLASLPPRLTVEFSQALGAQFARAQVRAPDGRAVETEPRVQGRELVVPIDARPMDAGEYAVDFRVTSEDGHPVSGSVTFAVEADAPTTATPQPGIETGPETAAEEAVAVTVTDGSDGPESGPLTPSESERPFAIVLAFLATAAVAVLAIVRLRRGGPDRQGPDRDDEDEPRT